MVQKLLRKLERYDQLSEEERAFLEKAPERVVEYGRQEAITREGEALSHSCLVVEGLACRFKTMTAGTRQIIAIHIPGDFCDLHSFLLKKMDHGVAAIGHCKIAKIPHAKITEITERYPPLTRALWWDTAMDAAIHREWIVSMGRRNAYQQIAHLFCELLFRFRAIGLASSNSYELPTTQADLGDMLGLSFVHINRTLQSLRAEGLIIFKEKTVTIPDLDRLMQAADFDPTYLQVHGGPLA